MVSHRKIPIRTDKSWEIPLHQRNDECETSTFSFVHGDRVTMQLPKCVYIIPPRRCSTHSRQAYVNAEHTHTHTNADSNGSE